MKTGGILRNERTGEILAPDIASATNVLSRMVGLLGHANVAPDQGLWIDRCNAVHTVGMRARLDLYFLNRDRRVLKIASDVPPNRLAEMCRGARSVVELGTARGTRDVVVGDRLVLE